VAKKVDRVREYLSSMFGRGFGEVFEYRTTKGDMIVGESFDLNIALGNVGETKIELLQPLTENSIWAQALETAGESAHHMCFVVQGLDKVIEKAKAEN
jgi:hypothetical protein